VRLGAAAAQHLRLAWTGMDLIREKASGDYFILECNASAMFVGFSALTGCDVAGALAELLIELARA
jgi:D-alanine-D-alanine ligase-like ATP-grasp enzyme